jgi:CBS-domain-containing membrane protein
MAPTPDVIRSRFERHGAQHVLELINRLGLGRLVRHVPARVVWAAYVLVNGFVTIALVSLIALATQSPFVFPSLGPTAYLCFFTPLAQASSPRHALLGHGIGLLCGYVALIAAGLVHFQSWQGLHQGVNLRSVLAAALSLGMTGALMVLFRVSHPPAGATTLIVSLGLLSGIKDLVIIEIAVFLVVAQAFAINRLAGLPYSMWEPPR